MAVKTLAMVPILFVLAQQQQCSLSTMVQGKTAEGIKEYFPDAEVMNVLPCVLSIETHVPNVTRKLLIEIMKGFANSPQAGQLDMGMQLAGYNYFILGFTTNTIVYERYRHIWWVFDSVETARFFQTMPNFCVPR